MSQIITTGSLTHPTSDSSWDEPPFPPTLNIESLTPEYSHYARIPSFPCSVSSIGSTSSLLTNYALGMNMSPGIPLENSQLCLPTHQAFESPLIPHTPAIPLASNNTQFESRRENMPPPSRDISVPCRLQDSHYADMVGHGMVDHHSLPLDVGNFYLSDNRLPLNGKQDSTVSYPLPNVDHQAISVHGQPNAQENQGHGHLGCAPQHFALDAAQDGLNFPDSIVPSPGQPEKEDLRLLAIRYLRHPGSRVDMAWMESSAGGQRKVVIMLEMADVFVVTPAKIWM